MELPAMKVLAMAVPAMKEVMEGPAMNLAMEVLAVTAHPTPMTTQ